MEIADVLASRDSVMWRLQQASQASLPALRFADWPHRHTLIESMTPPEVADGSPPKKSDE